MNIPHRTPAISTKNHSFIDGVGRQVILHGVNFVNKNRQEGYLGRQDREAFSSMRRWGFNCVRYGVIWDGLEPQPGVLNESYLRGIDERIAWAKENNLYVLLDMHQDLYSALYADGAPPWATITGGAPHIVEGGVWSDAYFTSPAVQAALDHFWQNASAPDGLGLQDHYAACWQALAQRYSGETSVIGFDLMNEPFPGSAAVESQMMLFARGAELLVELSPERILTAEDLARQWLDPAGRNELLKHLEDPDTYTNIIDATHSVYADFERGQLMPFYQRIAAAIRQVEPDRILFLETSMGSNMGVYSGITPVSGEGGDMDPAQAYAPHGYDLVVDTPFLAEASPARIEVIFQRHGETARRLNLPMLVGEWGAFDRKIPGTLPAARAVSRQFERLLCGDTYWHFEPDLDQLPPFRAISRPYPERIAGKLVSYTYSEERDTFECVWDEYYDISAPGIFYLPSWFDLQSHTIQIEQVRGGYRISPAEQGVWLEIPPAGESRRRTLVITAKDGI